MTRRRIALSVVAVAAGALALASCSKSLPQSDDPGTVVRQVGVIGVPVDDYGISVTVLHIDAGDQSPTGFPRVVVTIRSESKRTGPGDNPDVGLRCDEAPTEGDWFKTSTWQPNSVLPAGNVYEGQIVMGFPAKAGTSTYPVATCTNARVVVTAENPSNSQDQTVVSYPVDAATIAAAIDAERGPA